MAKKNANKTAAKKTTTKKSTTAEIKPPVTDAAKPSESDETKPDAPAESAAPTVDETTGGQPPEAGATDSATTGDTPPDVDTKDQPDPSDDNAESNDADEQPTPPETIAAPAAGIVLDMRARKYLVRHLPTVGVKDDVSPEQVAQAVEAGKVVGVVKGIGLVETDDARKLLNKHGKALLCTYPEQLYVDRVIRRK